MQGLALLTQMGMTLLNGFGLMSMFQAAVGAVLFLGIAAFGWNQFTKNK